MKRLFLYSAALAFTATVLQGCVNTTSNYDPEEAKNEIINTYNQNFKRYVGVTIDAQQDWGFGSNLTQARAMTRAQETGFSVSEKYKDTYLKGFLNEMLNILPQGQKVTPSDVVKTNYEFEMGDSIGFNIIFSETTEDLDIGYYFYNSDEGVKSRRAVTVVSGFATHFKENAYFKYEDTTGDTSTPKGPDSGNKYYSSLTKLVCKRITIRNNDIPKGYVYGFFVKNPNSKDTLFTNMYLNPESLGYLALIDKPTTETSSYLRGSYVIGMEDNASTTTDFDCNDVIIAMAKTSAKRVITPEKPVPPTPEPEWERIIAEDLSIYGDNSDFDFNDIVLDVKLTKSNTQCILQAAGATQQIRIDGQNDLEVHKLFGVNQNVMVNTKAASKGLKGAELPPFSFTIDKVFASSKDVKIEVNKGTAENPLWIELKATQGEPASKIAVKNTFVWPDERVSLKGNYPKFVDWVKDHEVIWY